MKHVVHSLVVSLISCAVGPGAVAQEWSHYGADQAATKYSSLEQIHRGNVERLEIAWEWQTGERAEKAFGTRPGKFEATPILTGQEPLRRIARLSRRDDGRAQVALSARSPRTVGLRPSRRSRPRDASRRGANDRCGRAGHQDGFRFRVRSRHRRARLAHRGAAGAFERRNRGKRPGPPSLFRRAPRRLPDRVCSSRMLSI